MAKSSVPIESSKHRLRNIIVGVLIFLLLLAAYFLWAFLPGSTAKLEQVNSQFKPEASWSFVRQTVSPSYNVCFDSGCNNITTRWNINQAATNDYFLNILTKAGWNNLLVTEPCRSEVASSQEAGDRRCEARGYIEDYIIHAYVVSSYPQREESDIILSISKK